MPDFPTLNSLPEFAQTQISLVAQTVKRLSTMRETQVQALGWEDPQRRKWQPTPGLLPGKSHGQRSLVDYSPWGRKESDMTEQLHFHLLLKRMGCLSGCLVSSASIQKLFYGGCSAFKRSFDEFMGKKVVSPSYSSTSLGPPPLYTFLRD